MKNILIIVLVAAWSVSLGQKTETRNVAAFTGVKVAEGVEVYLTKGDKESLKVVVEGTDLSNVITEVSGSYLKVHMRDGRYIGRVDAKVYVTYVKVDKLAASSAGSIVSQNTLTADAMEIGASSAGSIEVTIEANRVEASASSAGDLELRGKVASAILDASSAGEVDADELEADDVEAEASSGGSIKTHAVKSIAGRASSGGSIRYSGNPERQNNSSSSGGSVRRSF